MPTNSSTNVTAAYDGLCSEPLQYATTSSICQAEFFNILTSSNCTLDPEGNVLVIRNEEARAILLINALTTIGASDMCRRKAIPFICLYLFELCGESGVAISPTSSQCEEIRDMTCQQEWMHIERLGIKPPDCTIFPPMASFCPARNNSYSSNGTATMRGAV